MIGWQRVVHAKIMLKVDDLKSHQLFYHSFLHLQATEKLLKSHTDDF